MNVFQGALAAAVVAGLGSFSMAQVTGKVTLTGEPPEAAVIDMSGVAECAAQHADPQYEETVLVGENGELANVIVAISPDAHGDIGGDVPADPVTIDQHGCMYTPHVMAMMTGQKMVVKNSDPFLHNVHSLAEANPKFNFGQQNLDDGKEIPDSPKVPEFFRIKCDVHPWMSAYVGVFPHPYFAVTGDDGSFSIANIPDGEYTFIAWHEKYGQQEGTATVAEGKGEISFTFDAASAQGEPAPAMNNVKLVSDEKETPKDCPAVDSCCPTGVKKVVETKPEEPQAAAN